MASDNSEITKLTERIAKDPKSKLFVPLAEEYKKIGDIEMSIHVLTEGLKNNPGYVTARSFLGRLLMDKGDLAGAQKEFEEVIKAIPDNLLAQKKLGDIYALQGRTQDAIDRYRAVVGLSPKDQETSSLIADLEAGRDITGKISNMKPHAAAQPVPAAPEPAPRTAPQDISAKPVPKTESTQTVKPMQASASPPAPMQEEAEEVLTFELLTPEPGPGEQNKRDNAFDFLQETAPDAVGETPPGLDVEQTGGSFEESTDILAETQFGQEIAEGEPFPAADKENTAPPDSPNKPDDFTTDTLAELYISQGFYEKAIDIYDRMLADNPGHQGLMDKLARLRALAGESAPAGTGTKEAAPVLESNTFELNTEGGSEYVPPPAEEWLKTEGGNEYVPPPPEEFAVPEQPRQASFPGVEREAREYVPPPPVPEEHEEPAPFNGFDLTEKEPAQPAAAQVDDISGFIPPSKENLTPPKPGSTGKGEIPFAASQQARPEGPASQAAISGPGKDHRKEAITRLEQWLKNIAKEK